MYLCSFHPSEPEFGLISKVALIQVRGVVLGVYME